MCCCCFQLGQWNDHLYRKELFIQFTMRFLCELFVSLCVYVFPFFVLRAGYGIWARGYKTFFRLNSVKHKILIARKYENIKKFSIFQAQISLECYFPCA